MDKDVQYPENSEEEYHFSEEPETPPPFTSSEAKTAKAKSPPKRKRILLLIGLVIIAFCVYKLLDILFTARSKFHLPTPTVNKVVPVQTPAPQPAVTSELTPLPQPTTPATPPQQPAVVGAGQPGEDQRLHALEEKNATSQYVLDRLSTQVAELQNTLANLNSNIGSVGNSVQSLSYKLEQQQAQAAAEARSKALACAKQRMRLKLKTVRVLPKPVYFVRAMIQGRAWLTIGCCGRVITVAVGDNIPGYGIVRVINPLQGTITTSAGAIIGYSPDDR